MNYGDLQALIELYLHRTDLDIYYAGVQGLVRERIGKDARLLVMESSITQTPTNQRIDLPADFLEARTVLQATSQGQTKLRYYTRGALEELNRAQQGKRGYTIDGGSLVLKSDADIELTYYQRPTLLVDTADTNPVLTEYPSLYLWAFCDYLASAEDDDENASEYAQRYADELDKANDSDELARRSGDAPAMVAM